jgi:hypothetical protein
MWYYNTLIIGVAAFLAIRLFLKKCISFILLSYIL